MIAKLRRRHRRWTVALAFAVPPLFATALLSRPQPPSVPIPAALADGADAASALWERDDLWAAVPIRTRLLARAPGGAPAAVELLPARDPMRPDVLVYWAPEGTAGDSTLPAGAFLIGRLAGARPVRLALPEAAHSGGGRLYLYSLGHQALLDSATLGPAER